MDIANSIDWNSIEAVLLGHYQVGTNKEGANAYPPLSLFKCPLLQKWFHIDSDPELESQIPKSFASLNPKASSSMRVSLLMPGSFSLPAGR